MKNSFLYLFVIAVCVLAVGSFVYSNGVGGGKVTKETRKIESFTKVTLQSPGELLLVPGESNSLVLRGPKNALDNIATVVTNGELIIKAKDPTVVKKSGDSVRLELDAANLLQVTLNSSGRIRSNGEFSIDNVTLVLDGSGTLIFAVKADTLTAEVKGSGDMLVTGLVDNEIVTVKGSGKFEGAGILAQNAKVTVNGSGLVWVNVMNTLDATVSGKGIVRYGGVPTVTKNVSGGGKVIPFSKI